MTWTPTPAAPWTVDRTALAQPLPDELIRQRLIDLLALRWVATLTVVEAPGGFGKTRAISQAVRDNDTDPSGIDVVVRLQPRHATVAVLGRELLAAVGVEPTEGVAAIDAACSQIAAVAPTRVAVILDDVHHLVGSDDATELVARLLVSLPTNGRLVLSGRQIPEVPRARLAAADQVVTVSAADLSFTADEQASVAADHGVDPALLDDLNGWPAAVRLAITAGPQGPEDFLSEEVIDRLAPEEREAIAVAVLAGFADDDLLDGCGLDVTADDLCRTVPLIDHVEGPAGPAARPHDLWAAVLVRLVDEGRKTELAATVARWHGAAGRHDQAISAATAAAAWPEARRAVMHALSGTDVGLSGELLTRWEGLFPPDQHDEPEVVFLRGMRDRLTVGPAAAGAGVRDAMVAFEARGDAENEARALDEHVLIGFLTNDPDRIGDGVGRIPRLLEAGVTSLAPLVTTLQVIGADLSGDFEGAVAIAAAAEEPGPPSALTELRLRYLATLCFLTGDGDAAQARAEQLVELAPSTRNRFIRAMARFANGDPDELLAGWERYRYLHLDNARDDFLHGVFSCMAGATMGERPEVERVRDIAWARSREQTLIALCDLVADVVAGADDAGERFAARVAELGLDDPLVAGEVRRFLAIAYVADPAVRDLVDGDEGHLGPHHRRQLDLARILLSARAGADIDWSGYHGPAGALTCLPLPWSVELASYLVGHDEVAALDLVDLLLRAGGNRTRVALRNHAVADRPTTAGAERLLASLPAPPAKPMAIGTQGELTFTVDGRTTTSSRARVRQILSLLILRRSIERDELAELLWPDRDPDGARRNLATNLSYLRRELEPDRKPGEPPFHVRQRRTRIELHASEHLVVDLWSMLDDDDPDRPWVRQPVLPDLRSIPDLLPDLAALDVQLRDLAAARAEALIAAGNPREAAAIAVDLVALDAWDERAHRALIGARLQAGDVAQARRDAQACLLALADLGVSPGESLRILLRQVDEATPDSERLRPG